jgi:FeS assembly SUF system protein
VVRDAARRLLTRTGLFDAKPDRHPEEAPSAVSNDAQQPTREMMEQDVMATGEQQTEHERDYFDFAPEPPPETEGVERPEGEDDPVLFEPVLEALKTVQDPEIPVNLVDLGLIYELTVKQGGIVYIEMTLTTPACPVAQSMPGEVENAVASVPGVSDVRVKLVWTPPWDRDRMSEEAKLELGLL